MIPDDVAGHLEQPPTSSVGWNGARPLRQLDLEADDRNGYAHSPLSGDRRAHAQPEQQYATRPHGAYPGATMSMTSRLT